MQTRSIHQSFTYLFVFTFSYYFLKNLSIPLKKKKSNWLNIESTQLPMRSLQTFLSQKVKRWWSRTPCKCVYSIHDQRQYAYELKAEVLTTSASLSTSSTVAALFHVTGCSPLDLRNCPYAEDNEQVRTRKKSHIHF